MEGRTVMSASVNKVILVGNLGNDPQVRHTQDGSPIVQLSVATSDTWKDRATGERRERTEWHRIVVFNEHLCKVAENYLKKGSKIYVEGALQTRKWTDNQGIEKYSTEIVLQRFNGELTILDRREENQSGEHQQSQNTGAVSYNQAPLKNDFDDEIPF